MATHAWRIALIDPKRRCQDFTLAKSKSTEQLRHSCCTTSIMTIRFIVVHLRGTVVHFDVAPQRNIRYLCRGEEEVGIPNDTVHRAAANDVDFKPRAACDSTCDGLLCRLNFAIAEPISRNPAK